MDNFSNLKAKKSLGQNFLKSKSAISAMITAGEVGENDIVLEVGPGKGVLTEELLKKAGKVIAVEKDDVLVELLREKFSADIASGKLELLHDDILNFNPAAFFSSSSYNLQPTTYKLLANIPYYITGQFLRKFLSGKNQPSKMVILLQKEVVKRITANDGKESILSISVKAYGKPKNIGKVSKENFSPKPKVDSAILLIDNISRDFFKKADDFELRRSATCHSRAGGNPDQTIRGLDPRIREDDRSDGDDRTESFIIQIDEEKFFQIVKAGFAHKRKLLVGNLNSFFASRNNSSCHSRAGGNPDPRRFNLDPRFHGDDRGDENDPIECSVIKSNLEKNRGDVEKIFETCGIPPKARAEDIKIEQWKCLSIKL